MQRSCTQSLQTGVFFVMNVQESLILYSSVYHYILLTSCSSATWMTSLPPMVQSVYCSSMNRLSLWLKKERVSKGLHLVPFEVPHA